MSSDIEVPNVAGKANPREQARMAAMIGSLKEQQNSQVLSGRKGENMVLEALGSEKLEAGGFDLKTVPTVYLSNCEDCVYTIGHRTAKIFMEGCRNVHLTITGPVLTQTLEIWKCSGSSVYLQTQAKTIQLDLMEDMKLRFANRDHMGAIVWQAVEVLELEFDNDAEQNLKTGFAHMSQLYPDSVKAIDQYIVRHIGESRQLMPERCIRLKNGFLSTDREAQDWENRNEKIKQDYVDRYLKDAGIHLLRSDKEKVPRNADCPCGSGQKYKKCCEKKKELTGVVSREDQLAARNNVVQQASVPDVARKAAEMLGEQHQRQKAAQAAQAAAQEEKDQAKEE